MLGSFGRDKFPPPIPGIPILPKLPNDCCIVFVILDSGLDFINPLKLPKTLEGRMLPNDFIKPLENKLVAPPPIKGIMLLTLKLGKGKLIPNILENAPAPLNIDCMF